jgi:uncharacterized protein (TIGR02186 family)
MKPIAWLFFWLFSVSCVQAETLITSLSTSKVDIASNYTGADVVLFGSIERDNQTIARSGNYDVVVTVRGPRQAFVVRQKENFGPIWLNRAQQKFIDIPVFLSLLSTRSLQDITTDTVRRRYRVGIEAIVNAYDFSLEGKGENNPFQQALIRLKRQDGLYKENFEGVALLTPTLFRANITLPATSPPGIYDIETLLFVQTTLLARTTTQFEVRKIGFEQRMANLARDFSLIYGLICAVIALILGWIASIIFRRD